MRPEAENTINAPIDIVWEKALTILPLEGISIMSTDKKDFFISGKKRVTLGHWGDDFSVRLIPKGEKQTIMYIGKGTKAQFVGYGHGGPMARNVFNKIKTASENEQ
jgi:hypothetical protein